MSGRERSLYGLLAVCLWLLALASPLLPAAAANWAAVLALLLLPGYLLDRRFGSERHPLEIPARALALSVGLISASAALVSLAGGATGALLVLVALATALLCLAPGGRPGRGFKTEEIPASVALLVLAATVAVLAAGSEAIARDRMWYMAYLTALAEGRALDWSDPMLASGAVVWRFAYNGWLATLAGVQSLASSQATEVFEDTVPVLLAALSVSASFSLARTVFGTGPKATAATALTTLLLLTTRWPFFSPERYPLFGRLAEDKTMALLILMPVALAMFVSLVTKAGRSVGAFILFAVVLVAVATSHAMVYLVLLLTAGAFSGCRLLFARNGPEGIRSHCYALAIVAAVACVPAYTGIQARAPLAGQALMSGADRSHPALRSHIRMARHLELPIGGPVVHPSLLADPLLVAALGGVLLAWRRRQEIDGGYLLAASLPFLTLAFTPWLSVLFGRLVLPWMSYRVLWALPFGFLLLSVLVEGTALLGRPEGGSRGPRLVALALVLAVALPRIDWHLPSPGGRDRPELLGRHGRDLISAIAGLPETALVAAAPGMAELIPALAGRPVLAFSDRGTTFFTGSVETASRRLEANAVINGLAGGSRRLRNAIISTFGVTHTVVANAPCNRRSVSLFEAGGLALCMEREHRGRQLRLRRTRALAAAGSGQEPVAVLGAVAGRPGLVCDPLPERSVGGTFQWRRDSRWSGVQLAVDCRAEFAEPLRIERLRVVANLPHANESLVYRLESRTDAGAYLSRQGTLEFRGNPHGEIPVPGHWSTAVTVRLVPSHLPYLNLRALELLGPQD